MSKLIFILKQRCCECARCFMIYNIHICIDTFCINYNHRPKIKLCFIISSFMITLHRFEVKEFRVSYNSSHMRYI